MNLKELCEKKLSEFQLDKDQKYKKRLKWEIEEIIAKEKESYFLDLYQRNVKYKKNENNLLVCFLLGIVNDHDINKDPNCVVSGDFPDIDLDYLPVVRDYLKNEWAPKTFGEEYVCNIGNYTTFGVKSALIDMARVHDLPRDEVLSITKDLETKDEDGKAVTWESALRINEELREYCEKHPDVAKATQKLINRIRGMGVHAGGLIISKIPLTDLVPLVRRKDDPQASAWPEGLSGQDLQPVGLVKFDLLVISNLLQIARCCELVKKRYKLEGICNLPGQSDWTDVDKWRNDPKSIALANKGDLKCVFQFDSYGMRDLVKRGGVDGFEDVVSYAALFRPGCIFSGMTERYVQRKRGREKYSLHPIMQPILGRTYGVMVYQEQIMKILNVVGNIPLKDCEFIRKAISKKKLESFIKYKEQFIINGQKILSCSEKEIVDLWSQVETFSEYGFNKSLTKDTIIDCVDGSKKIEDIRVGDKVYCVNEEGEQAETEVVAVHDHGVIDVVEVTFDDGYSVKCTLDHKFLTEEGQVPLWKIIQDNLSVLSSPLGVKNAKKKKLGSCLRGNIRQQKQNYRTSQELHKMQRNISTKENGKTQSQSSLWTEISNEIQISRAFERMPGLYLYEMEGEWKETHIPMRDRISERKNVGRTSSSLRKMHRNKKEKYSRTHGQIEQGQSCSRTQGDIFCNCQENFCKKGCSGSKSGSIKKMERQQSKGACKKHSKSYKIYKNFQSGNLVEIFLELGKQACSLWEKKEICGFSQRKDMDRSGWSFPFLENKKQEARWFSQIRRYTKQGSNAQGGMFEEERCNSFEVEHEMFSLQNRRDEQGVFGFTPNYAPISDTRGLVHRRVLRVVPMGKRQCYDLEVDVSTHNFILPNGIVTSNSHACAYTYISMWLIYLKAHYLHEFYTSMLTCETLSDKIKDYKIEAKMHKVDMHPIDINLSKENFELGDDNLIYYGFSKIKGIGDVPAAKIVQNQPYSSFEDFLHKFGTDSSVLKPLIGLRCFKDADPVTLWKFAEHYKDCLKKNENKKLRLDASKDRYEKEFKEICPDETVLLKELQGDSPFDDIYWKNKYNIDVEVWIDKEIKCKKDDEGAYSKKEYDNVKDFGEEDGFFLEANIVKYYKKGKVKRIRNKWKQLKKLWVKHKKDMNNRRKFNNSMPSLHSFDPNSIQIDEKIENLLRDSLVCEKEFYGFHWIHPLELSPDFVGDLTFDALKSNPKATVDPVELMVIKVEKKQSKKNSNYYYYQIIAEDCYSQRNTICVWSDDYAIWHEELKEGNLLRMRLQPPTNGYATFTLESNTIGKFRNSGKKYKTKDQDPRIYLMSPGKRQEDETMTDDEALEQFMNCKME